MTARRILQAPNAPADRSTDAVVRLIAELAQISLVGARGRRTSLGGSRYRTSHESRHLRRHPSVGEDARTRAACRSDGASRTWMDRRSLVGILARAHVARFGTV